MKIALINPPFLFPSMEEIGLSHCLGLRSLVSYLKIHGHNQIQFFDTFLQGFDFSQRYANGYRIGLASEDIAERISADTDLIGISAPFSQLAPVVHDIAEKIKIRHPNACLVMGGIYPSTQPELALTSAADYIVIGEGEIAFEKLAAGTPPGSIQGVYNSVPSDGFTSAELIEDIDQIPFPELDIPFIEKYFTLSPRAMKGPVASIVTSRGCPFACEFCSIHPVYGRKFRAHSASYVLEFVEILRKRYEIQNLEFEDDNFTFQYQRTVDILQGITRMNQHGEPIQWRTPNGIRIGTLDEDLIRLMKTANCQSVSLALEHGDPEMLDIMNKKMDLDKAFDVIRLMIKHRIPQIVIYIIVGYPGETRQRFLNSMKFLTKVRRLGGNIHVCVNIAQPYPGTRLTERCIKEGIIPDADFKDYLVRPDIMSTAHTISITTQDFDAREVLRRREEIRHVFESNKYLHSSLQKFLPQTAIDQLKRGRGIAASLKQQIKDFKFFFKD